VVTLLKHLANFVNLEAIVVFEFKAHKVQKVERRKERMPRMLD
jgi:hypothetical protein